MDERKKKLIMYLLTITEESSSDSSDEELNLTIALALTQGKRRKKPRVENYILTETLYSDLDFKSHFRSIADRFNVGKASAYRAVMRVMDLLIEKIDIFIHWPSNQEMPRIMRDFQKVSAFTKTIGAIDGTEIEIECTGQDYIN